MLFLFIATYLKKMAPVELSFLVTYSPWNSPGQKTGVGSLALLQSIFLTQELNQGLLHCS